MSTRRGRRMSTARSYLAPARHRNNLTVVTNAHATRVLFAGRRAVGVEYANGTNRETVRARHGVVLCAGAVQSPQLLQSSGVGAPALLERHRIPVVAPLAGVGSNLQDHVQVRPIYRVQGAETLNDLFHNKLLGAREVVKYVFARTGAMAWGVYRAGAFYRSDASVAWPDVQIHFGLVSFDRPLQPPHRFSAVTISAAILRPESRGSIEIASADPMAAPLIRANYLTDPRDRALAIAMVRAMRELAATEPLAHYLLAEERPGAGVTADAALHDWIGQSCTSIFHPVGTCAMGPASDANAVVDARLRVHGLDGLRVVDGSIMPRLVSGNTNAPIIMIGEKAADLLREDLR
jgi:choline dehydrogenase